MIRLKICLPGTRQVIREMLVEDNGTHIPIAAELSQDPTLCPETVIIVNRNGKDEGWMTLRQGTRWPGRVVRTVCRATSD